MNELPLLNFPSYEFKITRNNEGQLFILDPVRRAEVSLTPEEWVRQHVIQYFQSASISRSLIGVERSWKINKQQRRTDIIVFNNELLPILLVECKSPFVKITSKEIEQILKYNLHFNCNRLYVTNGIVHYYYFRDGETSHLLSRELIADDMLKEWLNVK